MTRSSATLYAAVAAIMLTGCEGDAPPPRKFSAGQMVEFVLTGHKAQIIHVNYCEKSKRKPHIVCTYEVRVFAPQTRTDVSLFGEDGPVSSNAISRVDYVREFELREAKT
jgi:hypothetical protein